MISTRPLHADTIDKIVETYFACVTKESFTYKGERYDPRPLRVSPMIFRGYVCPEKCGGCCKKFTLDYLPSEVATLMEGIPSSERPFWVAEPRTVEFNGRAIEVWTDAQLHNQDSFCRHLKKENGRCGIHGFHPFSCDFELIRFLTSQTGGGNQLTQKLFGRGWSFTRVDGEKGALCYMTPVTKSNVADVSRKLSRLKEWSDHFGLKTVLPDMIQWVKTGPHVEPLLLNTEFANVKSTRSVLSLQVLDQEG